jgi:hypothetical protein
MSHGRHMIGADPAFGLPVRTVLLRRALSVFPSREFASYHGTTGRVGGPTEQPFRSGAAVFHD